jgi:hypothetical protein
MSGAAATLVPWIGYLATSLPMRHVAHHWRLTWVGFDVALVSVFTASAVAARRRSKLLPDLLVVAGVLLLCDAWFDLATAATGRDVTVAALEAFTVEGPLAITCFVLSARWRDARSVPGRETEAGGKNATRYATNRGAPEPVLVSGEKRGSEGPSTSTGRA